MTQKTSIDFIDTLLNNFRKKDQKKILRYYRKAIRQKRKELREGM